MVVFGKGWPFIYPSLWDGVAINLAISSGEGGDLFIHLLGKGMPPIYPSIYEGMANNLPIYLGGDNPLSTYLFVKGCPSSWVGIVMYLISFLKRNGYLSTHLFERGWLYLGRDGHLSIYLFGKGLPLIQQFLWERVGIYLFIH